jgi:hypothetical protein
VILEAHLACQVEQRAEAGLEIGVAVDLAIDVADHAAQPGAQEPELTARPPELMGMGVAADHDGGALGQAQVSTRISCSGWEFLRRCLQLSKSVAQKRSNPRQGVAHGVYSRHAARRRMSEPPSMIKSMAARSRAPYGAVMAGQQLARMCNG